MQCWDPQSNTVSRIRRLCPALRSLRVLMDDLSFRELEPLAGIEELEAHLTWSGLTAGLELYCESLSSSLTSLELTLLDCFSWRSVVGIGSCCPGLERLHLTLWREDWTDLGAIAVSQGGTERRAFARLQVLRCFLAV